MQAGALIGLIGAAVGVCGGLLAMFYSIRKAGIAAGSDFNRKSLFRPRFAGRVQLERVPEDFVERLQRRVEEGFLIQGNRLRADYAAHVEGGAVRIVAGGYWTAINIGLNDVRITKEDENHMTYEVTFGRWMKYAMVLCATIAGIALLALYCTELYVPNFSGPSTRWLANFALAFFFGVVWPLALTEFHKKPAATCLERIIRETLG